MTIFAFIAVPLLLFLVFRLILPNQQWEFDYDTHHATFSILLPLYMRGVTAQIAVSCLMIVLARLQAARAPLPALFACVGYSVLFEVWIVFAYESYLHGRYPRSGILGSSNYGTTKYSISMALGVSSMILFLVGLVNMCMVMHQ